MVLCYFLLSPGVLALNVTYDVIGMSSVVAILVGVRRYRPARAAAWYLFCAGAALFVVGDEIWTVQESFFGVEVPFPSVADAFYLGGYPFMAAGLLLFVHGRAAGGDRAAFIDTAIVTVGGGVLVWVFLVAPYALDASLSPAERLVSAAYPLADVLLLAAAARLAFAPGGRSAAGYLLLAGIAAFMGADLVYAGQGLYGTYETGDLLDAGWLVGYLLPGAAALHPAMRSLTEPAAETWRTTARSRLVVIVAVALALPVTLAFREAGDGGDGVLVLAGGTSALFLLVLVRMEGLVRDREKASRLYERAAERERALRRAGARLVGAFSREEIHAVALDAALELAGDGKTRASVAIGPPERLKIVAAAGDGAAEIEGTVFGAGDLPEPLRRGFSGRGNVEVRGEEAAKMSGALGLGDEAGTVLVRPFAAGGETLGAIVASTGSAFSEEMRDGFAMLGSQVSLALESVALAEDLHEKRSYEKFQTLVQNSSDIITLADAGGTVLYQSPSMEWVLGHDPELRVGRNLLRTRLVHPEDLARHNAAIAEAVRDPGAGVAGRFRMLHRDGSWRYMEGTFRGLAGESGVRGVVVNIRDVTERVEAEERLKEAEARYRALVEQVPVMVYVQDAETLETVYDSPRIETMLGYPRDICEKDPGYWVGILHPQDREWVMAEEAAAREKDAFGHEYRVIAADGREVWVRDEATLVRDAEGNPRHWQGVISDVTERKALEE